LHEQVRLPRWSTAFAATQSIALSDPMVARASGTQFRFGARASVARSVAPSLIGPAPNGNEDEPMGPKGFG
jgi:hypothetical protein